MKTPAFVLPIGLVLTCASANAQVLVTEIQPNPNGSDFAEWIELHNIGATPVDISGWTLNEFAAGTASSQWSFPSGTSIAADQVLLITRQARAFKQRSAVEWNNVAPDFEMAAMNDDATVPNMEGGPNFNLVDQADAVILRDDLGAYVDGVEYGMDYPEVPGLPVRFWPMANNEGLSVNRVDTAASSSEDDFTVTNMTSAGVGYIVGMGTPPMIIAPAREPLAMTFGQMTTLTSSIVDIDGVASVTYHVAIATTVDGAAEGNYIAIPAVTRGRAWVASGPVENFANGLSFSAPSTFHDRYLRWYIEATDSRGAVSFLPMNATSMADNTDFFWENVLPATGIATLAEARSEDGDRVLDWPGHMVRVEGVATTDATAFSTVEENFFLASPDSLDAVLVQDNVANPIDVNPGDVVRVEGRIADQQGLRQIGEDKRPMQSRFLGYEIALTLLGTAEVPAEVATIGTLLANGEAYEAQLVTIPNVNLVMSPDGDPVPAVYPTNDSVWISDGTGMLEVRISGATDVTGEPTPTETFSLRGILTQFDPMNTGGGYRISPRAVDDLLSEMPGVDAGVIDSGVRPDSGSVDPNRDAGPGGTTRDAGPGSTARDAGFPAGGGTDDEKGCGCTETPTPGSGPASAGALLLIGAALALRRRR